MSNKPIKLNEDNQIVDLAGMTLTVEDLKQCVIDAHFYKGKLKELLGGK